MMTCGSFPPGQGHGDPNSSPATASLKEEHEVILRALSLLERVGERLDTGQGAEREALNWLSEFFRTFADRCHHGKEEQHLFPAMERHGVPRYGGPIAVMLAEHEEGRGYLRRIAGGGPEVGEAIRNYVSLLRAHIDKENHVLFLIADQVLDSETQKALLRAFEQVEGEVGTGAHERYLSELAYWEKRILGEGT